MKIDPTNTTGPDLAPAGAKPAPDGSREVLRNSEANRIDASVPPARSGGTAEGSEGTDQVQLSNLLENLRRTSASSAVSGEEEITPERAAYLDKLAAQVDSGEYGVDAAALSARIIDDTIKGIG